MAGRGSACGAPNREKKTKISPRDQPLTSLFTSDSLLGSRAMVSFGGVGGVNESGNSFYHFFDPLGNGDEYLDEYCNQPEKKKRLSVDQVQFLERSFETENKLEPERKFQLADELGLQPRQIAVWFQNRRARWKTKHLETEYETLHASYKCLKTDYDCLLKENDKLKAEVSHLKNNGLTRAQCYTKEPSQAVQREATGSRNDDQSSVRSDMSTNADSPETTDDARLLSDESRHMFVADHTDSSRNIGEDIMNEELLQYGCMTDDAYCTPHSNLCGYGFNIEDHGFSF